MQTVTLIFVCVVASAALVFFTVATIAVLKASSDSDDMEEMIQHQAKIALEERDAKKGNSDKIEGISIGRRSTYDFTVGENKRNQQIDSGRKALARHEPERSTYERTDRHEKP